MPSPQQFPERISVRDFARGAAAFRAGYPCIPPTRSTRREDWIRGWKEASAAAAKQMFGPKVENTLPDGNRTRAFGESARRVR